MKVELMAGVVRLRDMVALQGIKLGEFAPGWSFDDVRNGTKARRVEKKSAGRTSASRWLAARRMAGELDGVRSTN
jgi:hypothetical protein